MEKNNRSSKTVTWVIVIICVVLAAFIIWGIVSMLDKLSAYGNSTSIHQVQSEETVSDTAPEEDPYDGLPLNQYDETCFSNLSGLKRYEDDEMIGIPGIDVSSYQNQIDWQQVKDSGVEFAMIRLGYRGYTTGKLDLDDRFLENMEGASSVGIKTGIYFFSQALTEEEAVEEAEFVLNWVRGYDLDYPIVFDWEEIAGNARTDEMNMLMLTSCALAFCQRIEEAGYQAGVYFNQVYGYQQLHLPSLQDYMFWLASYEDTPSFYFDFQMWQYSDQGAVPGISAPVDLNIAFSKK